MLDTIGYLILIMAPCFGVLFVVAWVLLVRCAGRKNAGKELVTKVEEYLKQFDGR